MTSRTLKASIKRSRQVTIRTGIISGSLICRICCQAVAPSIFAASKAERGNDCSAARERIKINGVHCQMSAMITLISACWPSQSTVGRPRLSSVRLNVPTVGWYMYLHISPTTTGAIIIGRINIVRKTDMPRIFRSNSIARPTPRIISSVTTIAAKRRVTPILSRNASSVKSFA